MIRFFITSLTIMILTASPHHSFSKEDNNIVKIITSNPEYFVELFAVCELLHDTMADVGEKQELDELASTFRQKAYEDRKIAIKIAEKYTSIKDPASHIEKVQKPLTKKFVEQITRYGLKSTKLKPIIDDCIALTPAKKIF